MERQRDGTAIPSLATEYLQQADRLSGPEHQQAVRTIKDTLGSMFQGKILAFSTKYIVKRLRRESSWYRLSTCSHPFLMASFLPDNFLLDHFFNVCTVPRAHPFSGCSETSAGRTRLGHLKRKAANVRR